VHISDWILDVDEREGRRTIIVVVADDYLFNLSVLAHFAPKVFVEGVEVVLQLACVHLILGVIGGVLV
jgi:hypothetical protein